MDVAAQPTKLFASPFVLVAGLLALGLPLVFLHPLDSDEGMVLTGAWHLFQGQDLYQQGFEYVAPGSYYLVAWAWRFWGAASYEVAKAMALLAVAGASLGVFFTGRLLAGPKASVLPAVAFFAAMLSGPVINHNELFVLPAAWSLYFAVRAVRGGAGLDCLASGILAGCGILVLQHKGAVVAAALALAVGAAAHGQGRGEAWKRWALFSLATLLPLSFLLCWDLELLADSLIFFPMDHYLAVQKGSIRAWLLVLCLWLWLLWRVLALRRDAALLPLGLAQGALLATVLQGPDRYHLITVLFPAAAIFPLFLQTYSFPSPPQAPLGTRALNLAGGALSGCALVFALSEFATTVLSESGAQSFRMKLVSAMERHCGSGGYLHVSPFMPGLYFETRKLRATRYSILLENFNTGEQFLEARADLESIRPGCLVIDGRLGRKFGHTGNNPVEDWAARTYETVAQVGAARIMRPASRHEGGKAPSPPG